MKTKIPVLLALLTAITCLLMSLEIVKGQRSFVRVWYLPTTTNPPATTPQSSVAVDLSATPLEGTELYNAFGCTGESFYCAKGFLDSQVDPTTHKPTSANTASFYLVFHD